MEVEMRVRGFGSIFRFGFYYVVGFGFQNVFSILEIKFFFCLVRFGYNI